MLNESRKGLIYAFCAYLAWALLSLYWKALGGVPAYTTFSYRIVWTFVTMLAYFVLARQTDKLTKELTYLKSSSKPLWTMIFASLFIAVNWLVYIYAVGSGQATEASLGYYLMPLVSVLLSILFLGEKLVRLEWIAVALAALGALVLIVLTGQLPLVTFILALSFGIYGLLKKQVKLSSDVAMLVEAGIILPFAVGYLIFLSPVGWCDVSLIEQGLLALSGIITAIPLLLFAEAVKRAPLNQVGFIQYFNPTLQLVIAVFIFGEGINGGEMVGFAIIWLAVGVFVFAQLFHKKK